MQPNHSLKNIILIPIIQLDRKNPPAGHGHLILRYFQLNDGYSTSMPNLFFVCSYLTSCFQNSIDNH